MENKVYRELLAEFHSMEVIDTHEHLPPESSRLHSSVDFFTMFSHYCTSDLIATGLKPAELEKLNDPAVDLDLKWQLFKPHYDNIKNGGYARAARISMEKFYGKSDLVHINDAYDVTAKIKDNNTEGLYKRVLQDACRIKHCLVFDDHGYENDYFDFVDFIDSTCLLADHAAWQEKCKILGGSFTSLQAFVDALGRHIKNKAKQGVRGLKYLCAYYRTLEINSVTYAQAEAVFNKLLDDKYLITGWTPKSLNPDDAFLLQDYLIFRTLEFCRENDLVAVFHTGVQAGNNNNLGNTHPERLWNLFSVFSDVKFVLLHGGLPWTAEAGLLAKYFANVYLDLAWVHIISPEIAVTTLKNWIDTVPKNKIFGFGGDYKVVEKVYGHLQMAGENICRALATRTEDGALTYADASSWLEHILFNNARQVYKLK